MQNIAHEHNHVQDIRNSPHALILAVIQNPNDLILGLIKAISSCSGRRRCQDDAQTHKCLKEGSNRSVHNLRFQGRGLLTTDPCLISKVIPMVDLGHGVSLVFVVVRCGRVCVKKAWMVCCAVPKRTNAQLYCTLDCTVLYCIILPHNL